jgi:IPT/TIG domain
MSGTLSGLTPGDTLYIEVGGVGNEGRYPLTTFNGGGEGGGGGATDIRTSSSADGFCCGPDPRLLVAGGGGGGGASGEGSGGNGGSAGENGESTASNEGGGAGPTAGADQGHSGVGKCANATGEFGLKQGVGGNGGQSEVPGGGGGGGDYGGGGGGGSCSGWGGAGGGGGGSSEPRYSRSFTFALAPLSAEPRVELTYPAPGPPPTVTEIKRSRGPASGGKKVTIIGTNLTGAFAVKFGAVNATSFTPVSATMIQAVSPAETAQTVDVTVTTAAGGTSSISSLDHYRFGPPKVTGVSPYSGSVAGGDEVTITGTGFALGTEATFLTFGKTTAITVNCTSITTCIAIAPSHTAETVDVKATVNGQKSPKNLADQYTFE